MRGKNLSFKAAIDYVEFIVITKENFKEENYG